MLKFFVIVSHLDLLIKLMTQRNPPNFLDLNSAPQLY